MESTIPATDRKRIRDLARVWMEHAADPVMEIRKRQWKNLHDLRPERPMILFETGSVEGFVRPDELLCSHPLLRAVERNMLENNRHAEDLGDDIVVEPWFRLGWQMELPTFGVDVETKPGLKGDNTVGLGYTFNFPIRKPEELSLLKKRSFGVDRAKTEGLRQILEEVFGDILPVRVGNYDPFIVDSADEGFCGNFFFGLTWQIYRFIGNDRLLYWFYDEPETLHKLMRYMTDDRLTLFNFLEKEGLLVSNSDTQMAGPRAYGYVSSLPDSEHQGPIALKQLWGWAESQETISISPEMYKEFILPYLAELSKKFGLIYYGCCEPVHDRLDLIMEGIPNLRSVSISGWSDLERVAEMLGNRYVYSRKPTPALVSGSNPLWDLAKEDMARTYRATKNSCVELLFRDLYTVAGETRRLAEWVTMTKSIFGI